ncbi:MAG TPA: DNA primase [Steroidobacteraceae bacterium]|nr:DNA primase [Steroidobacteraceae bacterium]
MIPQTFIDELIARADIIEVIGLRVQLKKAGREYKACCPFHNEKTASFWVSPDKQFYHCFGCGAHGTVIRFLMEHDHLTFPEAVEELAGRLGLEVPQEGLSSGTIRRPDEPLYDLMGRVARLYSDSLTRDERAQAYVARRGLDAETLAGFGIGYAPNSWSEILRRFGATEDERRALSDLGLIVERDRAQTRTAERFYDRFRDRIMFPIRDSRGRIIAFGGRILDQGEPKYLNSPETLLFHKGRELYGLYEARRNRSNLRRLLIVEGYMDVVRLHQFGIGYAVGTLGTATTPEHLKRIFRIVNEIVFAFDGDRAGRAAAWRALQNTLPEIRQGREVRFLFLPDGHDPDTLIGEEGAEAFEKRLESTLPLADYLMRELQEQSGELDEQGRARFSQNAGPLMSRIPDSVYRDLLIERIGRVVRITPERLEQIWREANRGRAADGAAAQFAPELGRGARTGVSAGRGGLVRQAILLLLTFPPVAGEVTETERNGLADCDEPGIELLRQLLAELQERPARSPAQLIERWAGRPEHEILAKLLQREQVVADAVAAADELRAALRKLADRVAIRRLEALEAKEVATGLDAQEKQEYLRLTMLRASPGSRGG